MERQSWIKQFELRRSALLACAAMFFLLVTAVVPLASAASFTASLERDTVTLGESVALSLTFDGAQVDGEPRLPTIANLQITYVGPSSQYTWVNGQATSKVTHNFTVTPKQVGDYTIPGLNVELNGTKLSSQPLKLKVLKPGAPPPEAIASGAQMAFLRLMLPKTNLFLGEVLTGEIQLYLRDGVVGLNQFQFTGTPTEGFSMGKTVQTQQRRMQIGNVGYTVIPVSVPFTPNKTGPLSIGPITANVVIELPSNNRRRDGFGDPFGFFNTNERRQLAIATDTETVQCFPLPAENKPEGFNGAVGDFTMTVNIGPTNVATGDPITVRVLISGRGALDAVALPEQTSWHDFKTYPPTAKVETTDQFGLQGTKTFEQIVSPENTDIKELPAFSFSFFDPEVKQYRTLTQPATKLIVRPGGVVVAPVIAANSKNATPENTTPQQDIVPIKLRLGPLTKPDSGLGMRRVFIALNLVPIVAFFGTVVWRKKTDALANNPRLRRHRAVAGEIRSGLTRLHDHAAQNKSDEFFAELVHLLQERLGERLDCPASAITEAVIDEKLRPRGVPDSTLDELHELFQACNLARYAPFKSSHELAAVIPKLESTLAKLEELKS